MFRFAVIFWKSKPHPHALKKNPFTVANIAPVGRGVFEDGEFCENSY